MNGEIVTDSESDNADDYVGIASIADERAKRIIARKRKSLARRVRRQKAKALAARNFLSRKVSKRINTIVDRFPDIGDTIETFVSNSNIGADAWRRTGVLTFDGNLRVNKKVTYERIRQHLMDKYNHKFSYGTVIQLCVARNRRRRASKNYRGVAKVTTRRARKGFELHYNPDKHWSSSLYRGLNLIQYTDGSDIVNINRDDASGFRLDTLATHSQHGTPAVSGQNVLTTHTDYVNKYPSSLQTTSYNFTGTMNTEMCAGVKGAKIFPKNPAQHYADLKMLSKVPELQSVFMNPSTGIQKRLDCVRVDGATDEGPSHLEVKFYWAARHLEEGKMVTLLSSCSSGSSYLNKVELQNGCLSLGHANLFIPSTLNGSVYNPETGALDMEKVKSNLELATDVYIERVNGCPCGRTVIHLYRGANSSDLQDKGNDLTIFLKGSKKKKEQLRKEKPDVYKYFKKVWDVRQRHEIPGLPPQYLYLLVCCFQHDCPHPLCQRGSEVLSMEWYPGGPRVDTLPLPIPDPLQPWGNVLCKKCTGFCAGHFMKPEEALKSDATPMSKPPSTMLKDFYSSLKQRDPTDEQLQKIAKQTLLPVGGVVMWLEHLKTVDSNRKRGAAKAAETRRLNRCSKQAEKVYSCGICGAVYDDETEEVEFWVGCDNCDTWFHGTCIDVTTDNEPDKYFCNACV